MALKIKDLNFLDLGLPSGNKVCFDLVGNLYHLTKINDISALIPTNNELREIFLYLLTSFVTKTINKGENDEENIIQKGVQISTLNKSFFMPFLGEWKNGIVTNENEVALIASSSNENPIIRCVKFYKHDVNFNNVTMPADSYLQLILIERESYDNT